MPEAVTPVRMTITDLQSDETISVMFNPTELKRRMTVNYAKKQVLGNSHEEHEYLQTANTGVTFDLFFNAETVEDVDFLKLKLDFLESLGYGPEDPASITEAAPPRVLLLWPRTMSMVTRIMTAEFIHQRFNTRGDTIQATVRTTWEEGRITRIRKDDVRVYGALRPSEKLGSE